MDIAVAQQFLREHENAVLATWRRDGRLQMSPVTVGIDGAGRAIISSRETAYTYCISRVTSAVVSSCGHDSGQIELLVAQ